MARKDLKADIKDALAQCRDQKTFLDGLLNDTLGWPTSGITKLPDIAYAWTAQDLQAAELDQHILDGSIWQIAPLESSQPWGIFILEFRNEQALKPGRGMTGVLRKVLRGLTSTRRRQPDLPLWKREHLLFICTHQWQSFRFAYFRSKPDDPRGAKLKTFGWSPSTSNRTVCEFNLPHLEWPTYPDKTDLWVKQWAEAFDKDPLTDDFFKRFDEALEAIKDDLQEYQKMESAEAYTHAQLLLERLIFLYFLQNRGWLNQEPKYLPERLAKHTSKPDAFTFYKEELDKVFFALSTPPHSTGSRLPGIPFLNGGLFDDDDFIQDNESRRASPVLKVRNKTFQVVFAALLEAFNFTVTEDTPLNQEVAVDPEMLGKVFESIVLHAEQADPDATAPDKRKATGSYYTPRIVVHFICQEVLYQYLLNHLPPLKDKEGWGPRLRAILKTDASDGLDHDEMESLKKAVTAPQASQVLELVKPLRCCDPAVGSGAFPVGLLHELVNLRRVLQCAANGFVDPVRKEGNNWIRQTKEHIVQNGLFGVDIQQQAIEICRLRLWLSLIVDYDLGLDPWNAPAAEFRRAIGEISQLPNLEMNFHRGDSLHDHICDVPLLFLPEKSHRFAPKFGEIAKLGKKLHKATQAKDKKELRIEILEKRIEVAREYVLEEIRLLERDDSALKSLFGDFGSRAEKRERIQGEIANLKKASTKLEADLDELKKLKRRPADTNWVAKLRKLEGADFDSPVNFAWLIDFPGIFAAQGNGARGGFDIIVGNPPFVTARNPDKRELWRERWPRVCHGKYHMLCPFFELSFGLLKPQGELGFIVSNGFTKREFGKPLIEGFFPTVDIQKIVDCSGLLFPGHGTPTCLVFGANGEPGAATTVRNIVTLPGGGDLRTPPEESPLWHSIEAHHAAPGSSQERAPLSEGEAQQGFRSTYEDFRIAVGDCNRLLILKHPCVWGFFDWPVFHAVDSVAQKRLGDLVEGDVGVCTMTNCDEVFPLLPDQARRLEIERERLLPFQEGEAIRNWFLEADWWVLNPYDASCKIVPEKELGKHALSFLKPYKETLAKRVTFGDKTFEDLGRPWYSFERMNANKYATPGFVAFVEIATHGHFVYSKDRRIYKQTTQTIKLPKSSHSGDFHLLASLLNSGGALFWLKQVCFNKGAGEDEERDRFVYAGNKAQQTPVPKAVADCLNGKDNALAAGLTDLSQSTWERGQRLPALALRKLFEKPGEAYHDWNSALSGHVPTDAELGVPFGSTEALREAYRKAQAIRDRLRAEMIARQEEMDWLVYAAYGLLPEEHPAVGTQNSELRTQNAGLGTQNTKHGTPDTLEGLEREQRPFVLWAQAEGNYDRAVALIPREWSAARRALWPARLAAIRDNEHIRRIEQPVYKRRWDEQWKVGNQWRCGPLAYAAELVDAFEWWLREKAEWWLEHKKAGGPAELDEWTQAQWRDARVAAAWPVAAEQYAFLEREKRREKAAANEEASTVPSSSDRPLTAPTPDFSGFRREFKRIVDEETVPEGIPFAVPYEDLERRRPSIKVSAKVRSIRGKLNVPRERFHLRDKSLYLCAGLQFK